MSPAPRPNPAVDPVVAVVSLLAVVAVAAAVVGEPALVAGVGVVAAGGVVGDAAASPVVVFVGSASSSSSSPPQAASNPAMIGALRLSAIARMSSWRRPMRPARTSSRRRSIAVRFSLTSCLLVTLDALDGVSSRVDQLIHRVVVRQALLPDSDGLRVSLHAVQVVNRRRGVHL